MTIESGIWNVVIIGGWNRAILTPQGIAQRLFRVEAGTPVDVEVALDSINTLRVSHDGIKVIATANSLELIASEQNFECLTRAKTIASNALDSLSATPVAGAGINIRFTDDAPPASLLTNIDCRIDNLVSDNDFRIVNRKYTRSLKFESGLLNIDLTILSTGTCDILLNFHMDSTDTSVLKQWIEQPIEPIQTAASTIIKNIFAIESYNAE